MMDGRITGDALAEMVCSYLDDGEVALMPDDPGRERRANTWHYNVPTGPITSKR